MAIDPRTKNRIFTVRHRFSVGAWTRGTERLQARVARETIETLSVPPARVALPSLRSEIFTVRSAA
jgi:hypothetical protein